MDSMKYRDEKHIVRPDMINLLMQARKGALAFDKETTPEQGFSVVQESEIGLATHKRGTVSMRSFRKEFVSSPI